MDLVVGSTYHNKDGDKIIANMIYIEIIKFYQVEATDKGLPT